MSTNANKDKTQESDFLFEKGTSDADDLPYDPFKDIRVLLAIIFIIAIIFLVLGVYYYIKRKNNDKDKPK